MKKIIIVTLAIALVMGCKKTSKEVNKERQKRSLLSIQIAIPHDSLGEAELLEN